MEGDLGGSSIESVLQVENGDRRLSFKTPRVAL